MAGAADATAAGRQGSPRSAVAAVLLGGLVVVGTVLATVRWLPPDAGAPAALAVLAALVLLAVLPKATLAPLAVVALFALPPLLATGDPAAGSAPVKVVVLVLAAAAAVRSGPAHGPWALTWIALWAAAMLLAVVGPDPYGLGPVGAGTALLGYLSGWMWLFVSRTPREAVRQLRLVERAALACLLLGIALDLGGIGHAVQVDDTAVFRVAGSLIAPQLAMLAMVGVIASVVRAHAGDTRRAWLWLVVNVLLCFATVTRGAIIATALITGVHVIDSLRRRSLARGRFAAITTLVAAATLVTIAINARTEATTFETGYNTSGRAEAWAFYLSVAERHPWLGNGLGAGSVANAIEHPARVQAAFAAPHNEYLHLWVDAGLPLAAVMVVVLVLLVDRHLRAVVPLLTRLGVVVGILAYAVVDNPLSTVQFTAPLAMVLAAAAAVRAPARTGEVLPAHA